MQRIERYGVIALVFLLVTILAVSLWGEGQAKNALAQVKDKASGMTNLVTSRGKSENRAEESSGIVTPSKRRAADRSLPLTSQDESPLRKRSGRKGGLRPQETLEDAFVTLEPARSSSPVPTPAARTAAPPQWPVEVREPVAQPAPATPAARATRPSQGAHDRSNQAPAPQGTRTYVVRSGDTLGEIAQRELGTYKRWSEIQRINGDLDPAKLQAGMKLRLPAGAGTAPVRAARAPQAAQVAQVPAPQRAAGESYSVRKGDSLSVISQRELGTASRWKEIAALNPDMDPNRLAVGAKLVMPAGRALPPVRTQQVAALSRSERAGQVR